MRMGARANAAIEILTECHGTRQLPPEAIKNWGKSHRFAGARDRSEIGDLVFGALRWRASSSGRFGDDSPRAWVIGALVWGFRFPTDDVIQLAYDSPHSFSPLTSAELEVVNASEWPSLSEFAAAEVPEWLWPQFQRAFGENATKEGQALAAPAPLDFRVNRLKAKRDQVLDDLLASPSLHWPEGAPAPAFITPHSPDGIRMPWQRGRAFAWALNDQYGQGNFDVQDEGSQLVAPLALGQVENKAPKILDLCAGGGGKALALAACLGNQGQIIAYDIDDRRLSKARDRITRAGADSIHLSPPRRDKDVLADCVGAMDLVLLDAPCTGTGTWRRAPDSKWRLRQSSLNTRKAQQQEVLKAGATYCRPGGILAYVTCSVLPEENDDAVGAFLTQHPEYSTIAATKVLADAGLLEMSALVHHTDHGLLMTPAITGTDGFYLSVMAKA